MNETSRDYLVPASVIIAGLIVAGAIVFSQGGIPSVGTVRDSGTGSEKPVDNPSLAAAEKVARVTESDHLRGDPDAPVTIIEFSDFECPFCARIHPTLAQILTEYQGDVRWVYRHFPLVSIHANATPAAEASECIARLGGNDAFWQFADEVFGGTRSLSPDSYRAAAREMGIDTNAFSLCLADPKISERVSDNLRDATNSGARGTPYIIVLNENGESFPLSGALPYAEIAAVVDRALGK